MTLSISPHMCFWHKLPNKREWVRERERPVLASVHSLWKLTQHESHRNPSCHLYCFSIDQNSQCGPDYKAIPARVWRLSSERARVKPGDELSAQGTIKVVRQQSTRADFCWGKLLHISWLVLHLFLILMLSTLSNKDLNLKFNSVTGQMRLFQCKTLFPTFSPCAVFNRRRHEPSVSDAQYICPL